MLRFSGAGVSDVGRVRRRTTRTRPSSAPTSRWSPTGSGARPPVRWPRPPRRTSSRPRRCAGSARTSDGRPAATRWRRPAPACGPVSARTIPRDSGWRPPCPRSCATGRRVVLGHVGDSPGLPAARRRAAAGLPGPHLRPADAGLRPAQPRSERRGTRGATSCCARSTATPRPTPRDVDLVELDVREGDRLLLCSDGLTDLVDDEPDRGGAAAARTRTPRPPC